MKYDNLFNFKNTIETYSKRNRKLITEKFSNKTLENFKF